MTTRQVEIEQKERPEPARESQLRWPRSPFPPIADYAFLSDCERSALVAPSGAIEWLCIPRHDSPSIFGALLDRDAGHFALSPVGVQVPQHREYVPGTLVLETTWQSPTGWAVVCDALVLTPWLETGKRASRYRRTPPDMEAASMLVRTVRCVRGDVEMRVSCSPKFDYARAAATWSYDGPGYLMATADGGGQRIMLSGDFRLGLDRGRADGRCMLHEGESRFAVMTWGEAPSAPRTFEEAQDRIAQTVTYWRRWLDRGRFPDHPWRAHLQRSALTIKGLQYEPTGAVLAAATTSLPETPKGERNWDYRYSWIRDSTFTLGMLQVLGFEFEAADYHSFVEDSVAEGAGIQIMYGIGGEKRLDEQTLPHLTGYDGARPVRIGNGAYAQHQHDVWGAAIGSLWQRYRFGTYVPEQPWKALQNLIRDLAAHWREPDQGIWEVRGEPRHFASSKFASWTGAHFASRLAVIRGATDCAREWGALADEIKEDICRNAVDSRGIFTQYYGGKTLDASNLLMPIEGSCRPTTLAFAPRSWRRRTSSPWTASSCATESKVLTTGCRARRERSPFARSGSSRRSRPSETSHVLESSARSCSRSRARSGSTPRRLTRGRHDTWATSRKPSRTWLSSTPYCASSAPRRSWRRPAFSRPCRARATAGEPRQGFRTLMAVAETQRVGNDPEFLSAHPPPTLATSVRLALP